MNCDKWKMQILLAETGELSGDEQEAIDKHLASCDDCRSYLADSKSIVAAAGEALPNPAPSAAVMASIRARARDHISPKTLSLSVHTMRIMAYAAALTLIVGGLYFINSRNHDFRADTFSAIISATTSDDDSMDVAYSAEDELAEQLLQLEGFNTEDSFIDLEFSELEPLTTDLQSRNSPEHPQEKCV